LTKSLPLITEAVRLRTWKKRDCANYSIVKERRNRFSGCELTAQSSQQ
jgi:hypothetical protein